MLRTESEHDCYGAGHAGTALSAALGMAVARDKRRHGTRGCPGRRCGVHLRHLPTKRSTTSRSQTKRLIVVLNDNEWSIDKNVGAIASYLNSIVTNPAYDYLHERAGRFVESIGGKTVLRMARKAEEAAKSMLWPSVIFEELGLKYYGPIDGHDIAMLIKTFEFLKTQDRPVLLHVLTQKGKGFEPAMQKQKKFHGLGPYDPETGETKAAGPADLLRSLRRHAGEAGERERQGGRHHRRHAQRHRARPLPPASSGQVFRRRHRRGARGHLRRRHGDQGLQAVLRHLFNFPAARLRSHRARRLPAEPAGGLLHGSRQPVGRRRPDAPRPVRHQLPARHSEPGAHGAER